MGYWRWLGDLVEENGWTRGAELGLGGGRTFNWLLHRCPGWPSVKAAVDELIPDYEVDAGNVWYLRTTDHNYRL